MTRATAAAALAAAAAYGWWVTSLHPFHPGTYVAVAVAAVAVVSLDVASHALAPRQSAPGVGGAGGRSGVAAWLAVASVAVALEAVGLALGGRSPEVPTLSTTVDHLLGTHVGRWLLFVAWLGVGLWPLRGRRRRARS